MTAIWLRYTWDLKALPAKLEQSPAPLTLRDATKDELPIVLKVIGSAYSMDTGLADIHKSLLEKVEQQVEALFDKQPLCVALQHGQRIVGCSVLRPDEEADNNLVTGPCILHEYRSRGLGSALLWASLLTLRDAGLRRACGVAREKSVAARFLYPKFGSVSSVWASDLEPRPKIAA